MRYFHSKLLFAASLTIICFSYSRCSKSTDSLVVDFSYSGAPCAGDSLSFASTIKNGSTYLWDFGDGITSAQSAPVHIYSDTGSYTVTLVINNNQKRVVSKNIEIITDPKYTHLIGGARSWHHRSSTTRASTMTTTYVYHDDISLAVTIINAVTVSFGSDTMYYSPSRS